VVAETIITGGVARLIWCCRACKAEWPMTVQEQQLIERSDEKLDRRRSNQR
jgi:hypothetical protein